MKDYVLYGFTHRELREAIEHGLNGRIVLVYKNDGTFTHVLLEHISDEEAKKINKILKEFNKKRHLKLCMFEKKEIDCYV